MRLPREIQTLYEKHPFVYNCVPHFEQLCQCAILHLRIVPSDLVAVVPDSLSKKRDELVRCIGVIANNRFFINSMPPTRPSSIYKQQMELVEQGVEKGGKYLYTWEQVIPEVGCPFGLRLSGLAKIPPYAIGSVNKEMLDKGECLTLVDKRKFAEEIDTIKCQFNDNLNVVIKAEELCSNEKYILYRLNRDNHITE